MSELEDMQDFYQLAMAKAKSWGLKPFEIDFHVVPAHRVYEMSSYGLPGHFSHWTYGRDYWRSKTLYDHGHGRIYELIINQDPAQAFLLDTNSLIDNLFVIAHCLFHSDFFARNNYFRDTNRNIEITTAATAERFRQYEIEFGRYEVEAFIDDVFAIKEHISPHSRIKKTPADYKLAMPSDKYMDMFPDEQAEQDLAAKAYEISKECFPPEPDRDLVGFIAAYAPRLKDWQRDVLWSIRQEMEYFLPQMQTKIANEGWASIGHHHLMHALDPSIDPGGIDFADINSMVLSGRPGQLNPYWVGYNLFNHVMLKADIEAGLPLLERGLPGGPGWEKCLEIVELDNDESFIYNHMDEQFVEDLDLFTYEYNEADYTWDITEKDWERVRDNLAAAKSNMGMPYIEVINGDLNGTGGLLLQHKYDGRPLDTKWAAKTLKCVRKLWGKQVDLRSQDDGGEISFKCIEADEAVLHEDSSGSIKLIP